MTKIIGVTGPLCGGHDTVAGILENFYYPIIRVKYIRRRLLGSPEVQQGLNKIRMVYSLPANTANTKSFKRHYEINASVVTNFDYKLAVDNYLNPILKDIVLRKLNDFLSKNPETTVLFIDASTLVEIGLADACNLFWYVDCEENLCVKRIMREYDVIANVADRLRKSTVSKGRINHSFDIDSTDCVKSKTLTDEIERLMKGY